MTRAEMTPRQNPPWAQSHAITTSPPTCLPAISPPDAPTSPPISTGARHADLRPARRSRRALRRRVARARHSARGARADRARRHDRLADRVSRLPEGRHHRRAGQHAAHRGRLPLHAGGQPRQVPGRVRSVVSAKFAKVIKESPDLDHVIVSGENPHGYRLFEE